MINDSISNPLVVCIDESVSNSFVDFLSEEIKNKDLLKNYPVVYIHSYKQSDGKNVVYIGESNDIISRTRNHYDNRKKDNTWQRTLLVDGRVLQMYIIGHDHFNKSLTLDIENRLIQYMISMSSVDSVNGRSNAQGKYYTVDEFDDIFSKIWKKLRQTNKDLFLAETIIRNSAIFKASPLHKLTVEQTLAKHFILERIDEALKNNLDDQLIFIEGDAGTGKTVLTSSTFYEIMERNKNDYSEETEDAVPSVNRSITSCLIVNHNQQIIVYEELAKKLNLQNSDGSEIVSKPTRFINQHDPDEKIDVAFVDEAHLLLTQGKQSYTGNNQLEDIMKRARITVIMFDKNQVMNTEEYWEADVLSHYRDIARKQNNHIRLQNQIRMQNASHFTLEWINNITEKNEIGILSYDRRYDIRCFDTPEELYEEIKKKAQKDETSLSRVIATYDWEYKQGERQGTDRYWQVEIGDFMMPWNYELEKDMNRKQRRNIKNKAWAEQEHTINEIGSTFSIQGFDLSYAGVIIGPSVRYRDGRVEFVPEKSFNAKAVQNRTMSDGSKQRLADELLKNELHVLLTRGVNGLYVYAVDDQLRAKLKEEIDRSRYITDQR